MPAIRLPKVFCRPKPMARPNAPEKTANAVMSIPSRSMPTKNAAINMATAASFSVSSFCASSSALLRRTICLMPRLARRIRANNMTRARTILIIVSSEKRVSPISKPALSSALVMLVNCPTAFDRMKTNTTSETASTIGKLILSPVSRFLRNNAAAAAKLKPIANCA